MLADRSRWYSGGNPIHAHDVTPIQGFGMVNGGACTPALQTGLSHFALAGHSEVGRTQRRLRVPSSGGCRPGMLQPGLETREEEDTKNRFPHPSGPTQSCLSP